MQTPTVPTDKYRNSTTYQRPPLSTTTILPPLNQPCRLLLLLQFPRLKQQLLCLKLLFMADMDGSSVDSKAVLLQRNPLEIPSLTSQKMRKPLLLECSIWLEKGGL
ncbi:uncharacterized protein LOC105764416 isoform X2 [Gossypium raimondii]|uniref:uncharacterized protein LOC105764416 isoform X2 n=1 Tax=Gossypium raimondii TaxID=29730 RepID=UPI00227BF80E|nr:uncharacterized protein LOC105764416 isoform X2 [Gossypium raimondii]